ncbi:putative ATP-dependent RNA helicase Dbp21E2 isoform X2 [Lycorma delicatula]|uniref:putative ATP-dependent RNA helicase Dbp21E2 isoform X2 n=1 Tax=Lycorma delicatula TaxID=130591 RepID=UPI003F50E0C1
MVLCNKSEEKIFDVLYSDKSPDIPQEDIVLPEPKVVKQQTTFIKSPEKVIIKCKRPEFNHYKNQMYDKFSTLLLASKGWNRSKSRGDYFTINIFPEKSERESFHWDENVNNFHDIGLNKILVECLEKQGIIRPTKIQVDAIPVIIGGQCSIIAAETGCGKTLAFLLPIMEKMQQWKEEAKNRPPNSPLALIITPSRELACQILEVASSIGYNLSIDCKVLIGGHTKRIMMNPKFEFIDILVATVGVISKLTSSGIYNLSNVKHVVLDEADTLLDDSFSEYVIHFLRKVPFGRAKTRHALPQSVQLTLCSATMPKQIPDSLHALIPGNMLVKIEGGRLHHVLPHVPQHFLKMNLTDRPSKLLSVVRESLSKKEPVMVFSNRSPTCDWATMFMNENGIKAVNLNGDMPYEIRAGKFKQFQDGEVDVISCTDIGSRGLDTRRVKHVINYDFPLYIADYIHRCGRTGRAGTSTECKVTNFVVGKRDVEIVQQIETSVRKFSMLPDVTGNITRIISNRLMRNPYKG